MLFEDTKVLVLYSIRRNKLDLIFLLLRQQLIYLQLGNCYRLHARELAKLIRDFLLLSFSATA